MPPHSLEGKPDSPVMHMQRTALKQTHGYSTSRCMTEAARKSCREAQSTQQEEREADARRKRTFAPVSQQSEIPICHLAYSCTETQESRRFLSLSLSLEVGRALATYRSSAEGFTVQQRRRQVMQTERGDRRDSNIRTTPATSAACLEHKHTTEDPFKTGRSRTTSWQLDS